MSKSINRSADTLQEQSEDIECFTLFRFLDSLGKSTKSNIKSHGCQWNPLYHGWLCPLAKEKDVLNVIQEAKLDYETRTVSLPKGMISTNPKIVSRQSWLEILEETAYKEERQLLADVYRYNPDSRPEDFADMREEEGKTLIQIQVESDFH